MAPELHVFSVTPSVKYWPVTLMVAALVFVTGGIMLALEILPPLGCIFVMCAGLLLTIRPALKVGNTEYLVMNDRVIEQFGLLKKAQREIQLADIREIRIDWGKFGRVMDVGVLELAGAAGTLFMEGVEGPEKVRERILALK